MELSTPHPDRDTAVAFASLILCYYFDLCDRDELVSGGRSYLTQNPFLTASMRPFNIASSISPVHLIRVFLCPAGVTGVGGVAVALLRLLREVSKDIQSIDRKEGVGGGGGSITTK